jgi:tagaturonate reductase
MHTEIANAIPYAIDEKVKTDFANNTFERFCNPFIDHQWQSITVQYTSKMKMRNLPLLQRHYQISSTAPIHMATGFAAFLLYMKITKKEGNKYYGQRDGVDYEVKDDSAEYFFNTWQNNTAETIAQAVMSNTALWDTDLTQLPHFLHTVNNQLQSFITNGVLSTIAKI